MLTDDRSKKLTRFYIFFEISIIQTNILIKQKNIEYALKRLNLLRTFGIVYMYQINSRGAFMPLHIIRTDISKMKCDAIVNSTNSKMVGYSGVDLAIHKRAGAGMDAECQKLAPLDLGFAKITGGYDLPCKYVIHTSGPIWQGGKHGEKAILKSCYLESLKLAKAHRCKTVAIPLISSGAYGYPKEEVLPFAVDVIAEFLKDNELTVYLCVFDRTSYSLSKSLFEDVREYIDENYVKEHRDSYFENWQRSRSNSVIEIEELESPRASYQTPAPCKSSSIDEEEVAEFMKDKRDGFADTLFRFIDQKGVTDVQCYKGANVTKQVFSKIKKPTYKPSKATVVAFAISLKLNLEETKELLASAGFALSHSSKFDLIIEYCILHKKYDIDNINIVLFEYGQDTLGWDGR